LPLVTLTEQELMMAAQCGCARNIASVLKGSKPAHGFNKDEGIWDIHINGACGEVAAAKYLGRYWSPTVNTYHAADLGKKLQVRTRSRHDWELNIRADDDPEHWFILVTGTAPTYNVRGWLPGREARIDAWLQNYGNRTPAWFVPQSALHDIDLLKVR
jgi:hypothetical protein